MSLLNIVKYFLRLLKPLLMTTHSSPYHTPTRKGRFHFHPLSKEVGRVGGCTPPTSHYSPPEFWWSADILLINNRLQGWNRKSIPLDRESVKVLKSNLPCWGWENEMHHTRCYGSMGFHISYSEIVNVPKYKYPKLNIQGIAVACIARAYHSTAVSRSRQTNIKTLEV